MNRGSLVSESPLRMRRPSFNEAPIHESGKCVAFGFLLVDAVVLQ